MTTRPELDPDVDTVRCSGPDCRRPVRWVLTELGRRLPLDPDPHPDGNIVPVRTEAGIRARVLGGSDLPVIPPTLAYRSHWVSCPNSDTFRARANRSVKRCTVCRDKLDEVLVAEGALTHPGCDAPAARVLRPAPRPDGGHAGDAAPPEPEQGELFDLTGGAR